MEDLAIHVEEIAVTAGRKTLLSLDSFAVKRGEVVTIIGPNGAGKTTFLKACLGLQRFHRGRLTVLDQPVHRMSGRALNRLRCRVGYVPQVLAQRSEIPITVREVVAIGRTGLAGLFRRLTGEDWQKVDTWIDRLGLSGFSDRAYGDLSGGEQRKVLLARAMVQEPEILLLDEPTSHLDLNAREQMVGILEALFQETRITILLVCHELEVIPPCCRRLAIFIQGRLVDCGNPETVLTSERIDRLYGRGLTVLHRFGRHVVLPNSEFYENPLKKHIGNL
jgi:ABC-type cobalamin/Fe3+-siderophores transport system ATPase subunit